MPTPVSAARQCLTEEAARFLDDAVSVARRRCHAQTTSLHAVSALLSLPTSTLRDACSRARSCAYPPRLQFRALDLSVGVSLDRLPSSKPTDEPPVSNSLMAAIKRSQANQRRHPESFHLHQIHNQQQTPSILKVELKYFILSILDDPIVSRVFGEAGFRSCDIKLAIMHPPLSHHASRFSRSARCPPIFLCNLTDSDVGHRNFPFPLTGGYGNGDDDANCKRIGEVLVRKTGRNPLLIGVYAVDALRSFTDCVRRSKSDILPGEISGLRVICIEKEISEFVSGNGSREKMGLKFEEVFGMVEQCSGPGMVVNYGELSDFLSEEDDENDRMSFVVSQLMALLKLYSGKVWLIGAVGTYEMHEKFLSKFPAIEKDWDLHLLPITSKSMADVFGAKSSLMGSFVPFGGFFPSPSNFPSQLSSPNQSFTRCHQCTEKYDQEVAAVWKAGLATVPGRPSESSLHMPMTELDPKSKEFDVNKTRDDKSTLSDKVIGLQKKWNEICRLHQRQPFPKLDISQTRHGMSFESTRFVLDHERSGEEPSSVTGEKSVIIANPCLSRDLQKNLNTKQGRQISEISDTRTDIYQSRIVTRASPPGIEAESLRIFSKSVVPKGCLQSDKLLPSPAPISVTTDLGLGTLYATASENKRKVLELESHQVGIQHLTGSNPGEFSRPSNNNPGQSPGWSDLNAGRRPDIREFKSLWNALNEIVSWQGKATSSIVETILRCRSGVGRRHGSLNSREDIWLTFLGLDVIGKRKISLALAELMFGSRENLILVDFGAQDRDCRSNSLFDCKGVDGYDERIRRQTVVDYVAGELRKKPSSVVLLENVDRADVQARSCLSQAIRTGKFPDSHGRQIAINNTIFVTTSSNKKMEKTSNVDVDEQTEFSEERILTAKNCQMQIRVGGFNSDVNKQNDMNVRITPARGSLNLSLSKKRKLDGESTDQEANSEMQKKASSSMSFLDLNLPVEEVEEGWNDGDCDSDSISEGSETWLDEFLEQVDEKIMFKPYDFDEAAEKLVKEINLQLRRVFGSEVVLEIDYKIVVQILAANWLSEKKRGMEEWIEFVVHRSFVEAEQKYQIGCGSVMKLVCEEDGVVEEQAPGIFLPARIKLN